MEFLLPKGRKITKVEEKDGAKRTKESNRKSEMSHPLSLFRHTCETVSMAHFEIFWHFKENFFLSAYFNEFNLVCALTI